MTLQRRTPLARATKPIRRVSKKRAKQMRDTDWDAITHVVVERQKGLCAWCFKHLGDWFARHHFKLKSQGGKDRVEDICAVHHLCHDYIHDHPDEARARGLYGARESA